MTKAVLAGGAFLAAFALFATLASTALATLTATPTGSIVAAPSTAALVDIPPDYLALYTHAATVCPGLDWAVLAAIGKIETDHGRSTLPGVTSGENPAGAGGPMQFLQPSFDVVLARHDLPPGGARPPSRYDPHDAIYAAAYYLCDHGAAADLRAAVFAYNHSTRYVDQVLTRATTYRHPGSAPPADDSQTGGPGDRGGGGEGGGGGAGTRSTRTEWSAEQATVADPSGTGGHVTPRMAALYQTLQAGGALRGGASCWDPHPQNPDSDHPRGRACDIFFNPRDPADVAHGWQLARWLTTAQPAYAIHYIIWQGLIWTATSPNWATYHSQVYDCPNPTNLTGCHYDHIHISVY
jgi:hypothetical protein